MKPQLTDFPTRYKNQPPPAGAPWLKAYAKAKTIVEAGGILVFLGKRGTGKTRMAYELAANANHPNAIVQRGVNNKEALPAIYRTAAEMFAELRSTFQSKADWTEIELLRWYRCAAFMVIDELQESSDSDFENRKLTTVIDSRYQDERPTIVIANMTAEQFSATVSASIVSRMHECGGTITFDWPSYRQP